jgi:hypothetical protein
LQFSILIGFIHGFLSTLFYRRQPYAAGMQSHSVAIRCNVRLECGFAGVAFQELTREITVRFSYQTESGNNNSPEEFQSRPHKSNSAGATAYCRSNLLPVSLKTYRLITDFMLEVVLAKWMEKKDTLRPAEFFDFYESKSISHSELNSVAESTRKKIRQVIFYMLEQAEYLVSAKNGTMNRVQLDPELAFLIKNEESMSR